MAVGNKMLYDFVELKDFDPEIGTFSAYCSTFGNRDRVNDVVMKGAFLRTIPPFLNDGVILLSHMTEEPIGKPIEAHEDDIGLFIKGRIIDTGLGQDVLKLMRNKVMKFMSIGYTVTKEHWQGGIRYIDEANLYEASIVAFPANPLAIVKDVKSITSFQVLPIGDRKRAWSASSADTRVRAWVSDKDPSDWSPGDWVKYRRAFVMYDNSDLASLGSYKLPIADIVNDRLTVIPKAVFSAAAALQGARNPIHEFESGDIEGAKNHLAHYYAEMARLFKDDNLVAPWHKDFDVRELKDYPILDRPALVLASLAEGGSLELKAGRTISNRNADRLHTALKTLQDILDEMTTGDANERNPRDGFVNVGKKQGAASTNPEDDMDEEEEKDMGVMDDEEDVEDEGKSWPEAGEDDRYKFGGKEPQRLPANGKRPAREGDESGQNAPIPKPRQAATGSKAVEEFDQNVVNPNAKRPASTGVRSGQGTSKPEVTDAKHPTRSRADGKEKRTAEKGAMGNTEAYEDDDDEGVEIEINIPDDDDEGDETNVPLSKNRKSAPKKGKHSIESADDDPNGMVEDNEDEEASMPKGKMAKKQMERERDIWEKQMRLFRARLTSYSV